MLVDRQILILINVFLVLFTACDTAVQETTTVQPRVRAALQSNGAGTIRATVYVEGLQGESLSGAVVTITDERNIILMLNYNSGSGSYTGTLEELPGNTSYNIEVSTILVNDIISLTVPYTQLSLIPNIIVFQDAAGSSVLHGQSLSAVQPIQIAWTDCGDGVVYQVTIRTALQIMYTVSTNACTITVPAASIPAGAYLLDINAQKIHGDPYFRSFPYYSISFVNAPMVSCNVN